MCRLQLPFGGIAWAQGWDRGRPGEVSPDALLAASSSVHHALRAGLTLADLLDDPQPEWELAAGPPGARPARSTATASWTIDLLDGLVLPRARRCRPRPGRAGAARQRWDEFVVPGLGVRCVDTDPWVTGAESCELALALDALGDRAAGHASVRATPSTSRSDDGGYWTGYVYPDDVHWPAEHTTFTTAAVLLADDALPTGHAGARPGPRSRPGADPEPLGLHCGCAQPTRSPATPDERRSARSEPTAPTSMKAPEPSARR